MAHLYNQDRRPRRDQQQLSSPASSFGTSKSSPKSRSGSGVSTRSSGSLFRMSKRDVFSNEDCDESVGYPYARDQGDLAVFGSSADTSFRSSNTSNNSNSPHRSINNLSGISDHYGQNVVEIDYQHDENEPSFHQSHDSNLLDDVSIGDTTAGGSMNQSRSSRGSINLSGRGSRHTQETMLSSTADFKTSISTADHHHRQYRTPNKDPLQQSATSVMDSSNQSSTNTDSQRRKYSAKKTQPKMQIQGPILNPPPKALNRDIQGLERFSSRVLNGEVADEEANKYHRRKLMVIAAFAMCLFLSVIAGAATWFVLGGRKDKEASAAKDSAVGSNSSQPTSLSPDAVPTIPSTLPPTSAPAPTMDLSPWATYPLDLNQWAQRFLPTSTLESIATNTSTAPAQAFHWSQIDPYFVDPNTTEGLTPQQLATKRLDRFGLATLYYATEELPYVEERAWLSALDECQWPHYTCAPVASESSGLRRRLQSGGAALELRNVPVGGTLPPQIGILSSLSVLAIYDDLGTAGHDNGTGSLGQLQGTLPSQLGLLTHLKILDLHSHQLTGTIPTQLGLLTNLQRVYLHHNLFSNTSIPEELCHLGSLVEMAVDCTTVACPCCLCLTGGTAHHNIFDHSISTGPLTHFPTPPPAALLSTNPAATLPPTPATASSSVHPTAAPLTSTLSPAPAPVVSSFSPTVHNDETAMLCNGLANLCDVPMPRVLTPMVHNAMATLADGFIVANHQKSLEDAMQAGFRGFGLDVCLCEGQLVFCHAQCSLGSRPIQPVFQAIHDFLLANPHEVLILNFQMDPDDSGQPLDMQQFYQFLQDTGNLTSYVYQHDPTEPWPTLRTLIENKQRVILFHHNGPTCSQPEECPPGMNYYFDYAAETEFQLPEVADLLNTTMSCRITRGGNGRHRAFFGINNFLEVPDPNWALALNAIELLQPRVQDCAQVNGGLDVSFLYVDHWSIGSVLEFANQHNLQLTGSP